MDAYQIGYYSYEDSASHIILHEKKFSKEDFESIVAKCYKDAYEWYKQQDWYNGEDDVPSVADLEANVVQQLVDKHGFQRIEITQNFNPWGWSKINSPDDWGDCRNEQNEIIYQTLTQ